jgi:hypothetical protein
MKNSILLIILVGFITFSCDKDIPELKDEIIYTDLQPDIERSSIRGTHTIMNPNCGPLPLPNDSITYFDLDLNNDSEPDFQIEIKHFIEESDSYCGHCGLLPVNVINLKPLNTKGFISLDTVSNYWIRNYDTTQVISDTDNWTEQNVTPLLEGGCNRPQVSFNDTYWGLRLDSLYAWVHVERLNNNGIRIKEYAYNLTKNKSIRVGQKE